MIKMDNLLFQQHCNLLNQQLQQQQHHDYFQLNQYNNLFGLYQHANMNSNNVIIANNKSINDDSDFYNENNDSFECKAKNAKKRLKRERVCDVSKSGSNKSKRICKLENQHDSVDYNLLNNSSTSIHSGN